MVDKPDLRRDKPKHIHKTLQFSLDVPPSINHMYYNTHRGGKRLTKTAEQYIFESSALIREAIEDQRWIKQSRYTWLYVDMVFYFPDRRIRDASNCLKILLDVMEDIVYENDYTALPRIQGVEYDKENPRVEVRVSTQLEKDRVKAIKITS